MTSPAEAFIKGGCGCLTAFVVIGVLFFATGGNFHMDAFGAAFVFLVGGCVGLAVLAAYNKGKRDASPACTTNAPAAKPPDLIAIDHDNHYAEYVGVTSDGRQFFLTYPFILPTDDNPGCEFLARYIFDADGQLIEAAIDSLGPRADHDFEATSQRFQQRLKELGEVRFERINIAPFSIRRVNTEFGLIPRRLIDGSWRVELLPGGYMTFTEPWYSGQYNT